MDVHRDRVGGLDERHAAALSRKKAPGRPVGFWGMSMGSAVGIPFVAAEQRIPGEPRRLLEPLSPAETRVQGALPQLSGEGRHGYTAASGGSPEGPPAKASVAG